MTNKELVEGLDSLRLDLEAKLAAYKETQATIEKAISELRLPIALFKLVNNVINGVAVHESDEQHYYALWAVGEDIKRTAEVWKENNALKTFDNSLPYDSEFRPYYHGPQASFEVAKWKAIDWVTKGI